MPETGIIFDLKRFAIHDGPGIRTTVFLKGCPLRCWWCHNPESQKLAQEIYGFGNSRRCASAHDSSNGQTIGREVTVPEVMAEVEKDVLFYDESGGGVTFSGGEPLMQPDFLSELLQACRQRAIHTAVDTTGCTDWSVIARINEYVDLFLYDLKLMDEHLHRKYTGVSNKGILRNLHKLCKAGAGIIIRVPIIPGITETQENLQQLAAFVASLPGVQEINLLPYNGIGESKYQRLARASKLGHLETQSPQRMREIKSMLGLQNITVKIGG